MKINWNTKQVKIKDLIPNEKNPRKIKGASFENLKRKIENLGLFTIPTVCEKGILLTFHQRLKALISLGYGEKLIDVRYPDRELSEEEKKQITLASNINDGVWDIDILKSDFQDLDFKSLGLDIDLGSNLSEMEIENVEPVYPIVAKAAEKYNAIIIVSESEIDMNHLLDLFQIQTEKCYKTSRIGQSFVIDAKKLLAIIENGFHK
jgi:hypothetical protein